MAKLNVFICQIQNHNLSTLQKKIQSGPVVDDNDDIQFPILNGGVQNSSIFVQQLNRADSHTHTHQNSRTPIRARTKNGNGN